MDYGAFLEELESIMKTAGKESFLKSKLLRYGLAGGGGAVAYHQGKKSLEDWKTGRQYRIQMERSRSR